jgi:nucleoside-diphosphate-sugar epimerase
VSRFLVTGATGFIGRAVVGELQQDGHEVIAADRRRIDLVHANEEELQRLIDAARASHCIHCAWYTNPADYLAHEINKKWISASFRLALACRQIRFVGLGTCLEYDLSRPEPCAEDTTQLAPGTLYARCKCALSEKLMELGGDCAWARVFFVYGPGDRAGRLIPDMIERFARGEAAGPTYGGLRRDYIHVEDLARQIVRIATSKIRGAVNTGTGEAPSLSAIFETGAQASGRPELARTNGETGTQPPLIQADMTRFRRTLGDPGTRTIEAGLKELVG